MLSTEYLVKALEGNSIRKVVLFIAYCGVLHKVGGMCIVCVCMCKGGLSVGGDSSAKGEKAE